MSLHPIPSGLDLADLRAALARRLREPQGIVYANGLQQPATALEFAPDLTAAEQATLDDILTGDTTDRSDRAALVTQLQQDLASLTNTTGTLTLAQTREILARSIRTQLVLIRMLLRRGT